MFPSPSVGAVAALITVLFAAPATAQTGDADVEARVALAHALFDADLDYSLRQQIGVVDVFIDADMGFTAVEMKALEAAHATELEATIRETQAILARHAAENLTEAQLLDAGSVSEAEWAVLIAPIEDTLFSAGASMGARVIIAACGPIDPRSVACDTYLDVARGYLDGDYTNEELRAAAGE